MMPNEGTSHGMLTLINNASLYTPAPLGRKNVLVGGDKVLAISDEPINLPASLNVLEVDFSDKILMPGFVDSHAHITGGGGEAGFSTQVPAVPISHFTLAGVTTVVGLLGTDDTTRNTGNLLARVYGLREEGLSAYCWTGGYHLPLTTLTGSAKNDIVFLEPVIGVGEFAISDHRSSQPTLEEILRVASDTHVAGLISGKAGILHFHLGDGKRKLELIEQAINQSEIPPRVFNPTHVNRNKSLFDASCQLLRHGCYIDITAFPRGSADPGWTACEAITQLIAGDYPLHQITISSDGGGCMPCFDTQGTVTRMDFGRPQTLLETLQECLDQNLPLPQVLPMFTSNVADLLRLPHKGRLAPGLDADLIALDQHHQITDVMARGRWHKRNGDIVHKGTFE